MSAICPRFAQNAWKKDLCSNCFKSKEEHKIPIPSVPVAIKHTTITTTRTTTSTTTKPDQHKKATEPPKSIIKSLVNNNKKGKKTKVSFPKELSKVIGFGGEWSDNDASDDESCNTPINGNEESETADDDDQELQRITKTNTDFNTNNGNLLGDPEENIKKSFAALRLGAPLVDSDGKKQTLKITVTPFGAPSKMSTMKAKFEQKSCNDDDKKQQISHLKKDDKATLKNIIKSDGQSSPPVERAMEKSLLEEISETLEKNKKDVTKIESDKNGKIKFEITSSAPEPVCLVKSTTNALESKKLIGRHTPITKDQVKPKINVFQKYSDSDSNASDTENGISAYYDVVEAAASYENIPDGYEESKDCTDKNVVVSKSDHANDTTTKPLYGSSQFITDMLLSAKTHAASYSLHEGSYMTSKITSDGLIVTKCNSDDALDSTGSSFDGSSDEEMSYNMNRSESDSGIGISMGSEYQAGSDKDKKMSASNSNSDYEDIQIAEDQPKEMKKALPVEKVFTIEKSRELAGEPDGSADPDGNAEAPALPKSPPPITADARMSFLHGIQKNIANKKPEVPTKPTVNVIKTFTKRQPTSVEQQVITQLQQVMKQPPNEISSSFTTFSSSEKLTLTKKESNEYSKQLKKGRAPNPPPSPKDEFSESAPTTPEHDYSEGILFDSKDSTTTTSDSNRSSYDEQKDDYKSGSPTFKNDDQHSSIYTRNPIVGIKSNSPVIREKDKRERATVNPKFRSLNTFNTNRNKNQVSLKPTTPEPAPRKSLSMSEECLVDEKKKKNKFSIKKFLRMGTSKTTDNLHKKDGIYSEIVAGDDPSIMGKPRLVIIHPIDINPTAVEVVKEIGQAGEIMPIVTGKPPAPPQRTGVDGHRLYEINKPARPPPPKSAELRRKQKTGFTVSTTGSVKSKSDNVYANLGEIRSAIAPRKPERTASMREREAQLELARKHQGIENADTASVCSSNGGSVPSSSLSGEIPASPISKTSSPNVTSIKDMHIAKPAATEVSSKDDKHGISSERKKNLDTESKVSSKLELFERTISENGKTKQSLNDGLKNSVLKINNTIDNYLKNKRDYESMYEGVKSTPPTPTRNTEFDMKRNYESVSVRQQVRASLQETGSVSGVGYTRSEYGPRYGFNSLANIPRVVSASYCGSEMGESDIYSPYSFYGSEAGGDVASDIHDGVWGIPASAKQRVKTTNRLRMRKGRSVVHKNIEDNYSAVVVANHEALAQVLDQLQQSPVIPLALRPLANSMNLRFEDFTVLEGAQGFVVGRRAFHSAIWANTPVTLALSADCNQISGVSGDLNQLSGGVSGALNPITEFCDLVPSYHLPLMPSTEVRMLQATISVLPRMHLDSLQSIGTILKNKSQLLDKHVNNFRGSIPNLAAHKEQVVLRNGCSVQNLSTLNEESSEKSDEYPSIPGIPVFDDVMCREVGFIMLQLVNGLKNLQAKAIEEMPLGLSNVVLCKEIENKEAQARLCVLQGINLDEDEPMGTLCKCAHVALTDMLPNTKLTPILSQILVQERSESLSKAKSVLEFALWGPSDVTLNGSTKERELALQRWLDLERATVLHGLVRTRVELTIYDECHLMFLVRSNSKIMNEAAKIVASFKKTDD